MLEFVAINLGEGPSLVEVCLCFHKLHIRQSERAFRLFISTLWTSAPCRLGPNPGSH